MSNDVPTQVRVLCDIHSHANYSHKYLFTPLNSQFPFFFFSHSLISFLGNAFDITSETKLQSSEDRANHQSVVTSAVRGFIQSIALGTSPNLQDTLRLLTLWFKHMAAYPELEAIIEEGFELITIETWLQVIPQILARIHSPSFAVRRLILRLLSSVGKKHPQVMKGGERNNDNIDHVTMVHQNKTTQTTT